MADQTATRRPVRRRPNPVSVPRTTEFDAALTTIMRTGLDKANALRLAVQFLASGLESAWSSGVVPDATVPHLMRVTVQRQDAPQPRRTAGMTPVRPSAPRCTTRRGAAVRPVVPIAARG